MNNEIELVVTRHLSLVALLHERGLVSESVPVIAHASVSDVRGKHVAGVLPHHLSQHTASVTEVPMSLTIEDRKAMQAGDLTLERLRSVAGQAVTYEVFGGSSRDRDIIRASEERGRGGYSKIAQERSVWRIAAQFLTGERKWHDRKVDSPSAILCAIAITMSGQTIESGPILHADEKLRRGWEEDAPLATGPQQSWSGDGNHAGAEVDLLRMGIRVYASGPDWSEWIFPFGEVDITPRG